MEMYYHINNSPDCNWKIGDEIYFGHEDNYMWRSFAEKGDFIELNGEKYSSDLITRHAFDTYTSKFPAPIKMQGYHFNPILTIKEAIDSLGNTLRIIRELAFETIRNSFYPELPSRHKCIWLIPDNEQSYDFWKNILQSKHQKIFKVIIVNGKIHRAAQKWLIGGTFPLNETISKAHKYWKGEDSGNVEDEVLFEGKIRILEEVG
ncbi:MAG: DUF2441 domain-containing protein [Bacteroidota bacterium]|nr:DUF2441 domain-containing protein [Bacteroidota bacterium]